MLKFCIYILSSILVIWSMDSINLNGVFKKNSVLKARVLYIIVSLCLIYLLSNFLYDFIYIKFF